jgi:hypothetical protein
MSECFVIQPFDNDKYDRRFTDIFDPAIRAAGLEPYRVDKDPAVNDLVQGIKDGIDRSAAVFAELTTDNPNVWFELGYALARGKPFCMICAEDRGGKYPFDVRPLKILPYTTGSTSDYKSIEAEITKRLIAIGRQDITLQDLASSPATLPVVDGLADFERVALALVVEDHLSGGLASFELQNKMEKIRYTKAASTLAVLNLQQKQLIEIKDADNYNGDTYSAMFLTNRGLEWIREHPEVLVMRTPPTPPKPVLREIDIRELGITDEDIPF